VTPVRHPPQLAPERSFSRAETTTPEPHVEHGRAAPTPAEAARDHHSPAVWSDAPALTPVKEFNRLNSSRANASSQVEPFDRELRRLHLTVSRRFLEKLAAARDALSSHSRPGASTEELLESGLDLLLDRRARRNGLVAKPRNVARPAKPETVPAQVKREAWKRAGGRCEFRLHSGEVCGSTSRLELDHVVPRAHGGPSTIDNVRLVCREHNDLAARQVFGDAWMDRFRRDAPPLARSP
jgi:hypothetical protein